MLQLTTTAFVPEEQGEGSAEIPLRFANKPGGGRNVSIPFAWTDPPAGTRSFALSLVDTAPVAHHWVHWLVVDIPASSRELAEGASLGPAMPEGAVELANTFGRPGYGGPQPPPGTGRHPYVATLYALDVDRLDVARAPALDQFEHALDGHVLASATATGRMGR